MASADETAQPEGPLVDQIINQLNLGPGDVIRIINPDGSESEMVIEMPNVERTQEGCESDKVVDHVTTKAEAMAMGSAPALTTSPDHVIQAQGGPVIDGCIAVMTNELTKDFFCELCQERMPSADSFMLHLKNHPGEKPFKCPQCGHCFTRKSTLTHHMRLHTGTNPHSCKDCGAELSSASNLSRHKKLHDEEKPFQCHLCSAAFIQKQHYKDHLRKHTGQVPLKCTECGAGFLRYCSLRLHQKKHRAGIHVVPRVNFSGKKTLRKYQPVHRRLGCPLCNAMLVGVHSLKNHLRVNHCVVNPATLLTKLGPDINGGEPGKGGDDANDDSEAIRGADFWCHVCNIFMEREPLKEHLATHNVQPPIECEPCGEIYDDLDDYVDHCADKNCNAEGITCRVCGAKCRSSHDLRMHLDTHLPWKRFACDLCTATFFRATNLSAHRALHTGAAPFKCPMCEKGFLDKRAFSKHFNTHPQTSMPVRCEVCRDRLPNTQELNTHMSDYHKRHLTVNAAVTQKPL